MKAKLLLLACVALLSRQSNAQELHLTRTRFIGGVEHEQGLNISSADHHSILFTGTTMSGSDGVQDGDIPGNWKDSNSSSGAYAGDNIVVGRLDSNMQLSWVKVYGGTREDRGVMVRQTSDGSCAVLASTLSNDRDVSGNHSPGVNDFWLLKLDPQGNKQWAHCYGGPYDDQAMSFIQTPDKGFLMIGSTAGPGGDVPFVYVNSQFTSDWLLVKTDSLGNKQWSKTIGGTGEEDIAFLVAGNNGYYIVGTSESVDHECTDSWVPTSGMSNGSDYVVIRLDTSGNRQWTKHYGGVGAERVGDAIWDERDSSIVIVGSSNSPGGNPQNTNNSGDEWVVKIDKDGGYAKWATKVGDNSEETQYMGITTAADGGYVTVCETQATLPLLPGHIGVENFWIFKFNDSGHVVSNRIMGGVGGEETGIGIVKAETGFTVIGNTSSHQFTEGVMLDSLRGIRDIYISELAFWPLAINNLTTPQSTLHLYPNPAQNSVSITLPEDHHKGVLSVYDLSGKLIYSEAVKANTEELSIDLGNWAKGSYVAEWIPKDGLSLREKFIVY